VPRPSKTRPARRCKHCGETHRPAGPKQARFAAEYLKDLNATQAAIRAGYSKRRASEQGYSLLQIPSVACHVQRVQARQLERTELTADEVINGLRAIACVDLSQIYDAQGNLMSVHDWPDDVKRVVMGMESDELFEMDRGRRVVTGHSKKVKIPDRIKAFELLGKHLALFTEVTRHEGEITMRDRITRARKRSGLKG
jgi:phage terminase small subunit